MKKTIIEKTLQTVPNHESRHRMSAMKPALAMAAMAYAAAVTNAMASTLTAIPLLGGDSVNEGRAITFDGNYVVGNSGTQGFLYNVTNTTVVAVTGNDAIASTNATGVCYRNPDTNQLPAQSQIIVSGLSANRYSAWMTADGGTTWDFTYQFGVPKRPNVPLANGLAGNNSLSDVFYTTWTEQGNSSGDNWTLYTGQGASTWANFSVWESKGVPKPNSFAQMNGISSNGRTVGWRQNSGAYVNYIADYQGLGLQAIWNSSGLDGTTAGQAYSVSANGQVVFGLSPKTGIPETNYVYKATFNATFPGAAIQLSTDELPKFPDTTGFIFTAAVGVSNNVVTTTAIPFGCSADGRYVVGVNHRGAQKAVLWDTGDANPANWTVTDLTDVATSEGILGGFTTLTRAYSVGVNSSGKPVITGIGVNGGVTRGFVMVFSPTAPPVVPRITSISGAGSTSVNVNYTNTIVGTNYVLSYSTNLATTNWYTSGNKTAGGTSDSQTDSPPTGSPRRYYRVYYLK